MTRTAAVGELKAGLKNLQVITTEQIDWDAVGRHLNLVGFDEGDAVVFAKWTKAMNGRASYQWWDESRDELPEVWGSDAGFGFVVGKALPKPAEHKKIFGGGVWGAKAVHIESNACAFVDCDSEVLDESEQFAILREAGLPTPSFVVNTTGRGLHFYWRYETPLPPSEHRQLMRRIVKALEPWPEFGIDKAVHNPNRVMRLAGSRHPKTGKFVTIQQETANRYSPADFDHLPAVTGSVTIEADDDDREPASEEDLALIQDVLEHLPAEPTPAGLKALELTSYSYWTAVGMALKNEGLPMSAWDEWSAKHTGAGGYEEGGQEQIKAKWESFEEDGSKRISFLIKAARAHGYEPCGFAPDTLKGYCSKGRRTAAENEALREAKRERAARWDIDFDWVVGVDTTIDCLMEKAVIAQHSAEDSELISLNGVLRRYDPERGYYAIYPEERFDQDLQKYLKRAIKMKQVKKDEWIVTHPYATNTMLNSCKSWVRRALTVDEKTWRKGAPPVLAFRNGALKKEGDKWVPVEFSKDHRLVHALNCDLDPNLEPECPKLFRALIVTSYGEELLPVWRAIFNYHADPTFFCLVFLFLLGASGQGKGVIARLLSKLYSPDVVTSLSNFNQISTPEKLAQHVSGTYMLMWPDLQGPQSAPGNLYLLADHDQVLTGRNLHSKSTFSFNFLGRVVIASTQLPNLQNAQGGFKRRILPIKVRDKRLESKLIPDKNKDPLGYLDWERNLEAELGKIVSWALAMPRADVVRILNGEHPELKKYREQIESGLDSIHEFADCCLTPTEDRTYRPDTQDLFDAYSLFVTMRGQKQGCNHNSFKHRLKSLLPHLYMERIRPRGQKVIPAGFFGMKLVDGLWSRGYLDIDQDDRFTISNGNHGTLNRQGVSDDQLQRLHEHQLEPPTAAMLTGEAEINTTDTQKIERPAIDDTEFKEWDV